MKCWNLGLLESAANRVIREVMQILFYLVYRRYLDNTAKQIHSLQRRLVFPIFRMRIPGILAWYLICFQTFVGSTKQTPSNRQRSQLQDRYVMFHVE